MMTLLRSGIKANWLESVLEQWLNEADQLFAQADNRTVGK
jgi:hypothetical protein